MQTSPGKFGQKTGRFSDIYTNKPTVIPEGRVEI
jgi:hypothetical protein